MKKRMTFLGLGAVFAAVLALGPDNVFSARADSAPAVSAAVRVLPAAVSAEAQTDEAKKFQAAYSLIMEEEWDKAAKVLDEFLQAYPKSSWTDDARFWKCYVLEETSNSRVAVFKCYQEFIAAFPASEWADDARTKMIEIAEALAERGKPEYQAIVKAMDKSSDDEIMLAALEALGDVHLVRAVAVLVDAVIGDLRPPWVHLRVRVIAVQDVETGERSRPHA